MPQEKLPNNRYLPKQKGKKKQLDDLELLLMNQYYIEDLGWNCLGLLLSKMMGVMKTVKCGSLILSCCPHNPHGIEGNEKRDFSLKFSLVFAFLLFVLLKLHFHKFLI